LQAAQQFYLLAAGALQHRDVLVARGRANPARKEHTMTELVQAELRLPAEQTTTPSTSQLQKPDTLASGGAIINAPGLYLVPDRLLRRGAQKRKSEALRHREMLSPIHQGRAQERTETP
jgi:hypothetical protein